MTKTRKIIASAFVFVFLLASFAVPASAARLPWWLVNRNGHVNYVGSTRYSAYFLWAVPVWNAHTSTAPQSRNVIRASGIWDSADVHVGDYTDRNCHFVAFVGRRALFGNGAFNAGRMRFNTHHMNALNQAQRRWVMLHELGHTMGVYHIAGDNVMRGDIISTRNTLSNLDRQWADNAWRHFRG